MVKCPECGQKLADTGLTFVCTNDNCDFSPDSESRKLFAEDGIDDGITLNNLDDSLGYSVPIDETRL